MCCKFGNSKLKENPKFPNQINNFEVMFMWAQLSMHFSTNKPNKYILSGCVY